MVGEGRALAGDRLPAGARADAGLHRRAGDRRPRRDARCHGGARRRRRQDQPAGAGRARDRPLDPGGRVRGAARLPAQRRVRVRAQPRALRVPALGPGGLRQLQGGAAEHRHLPPGEPRVPGPRGRVARRPGVPRHARRDRLAHHDDQRARRARLGRRRHRGRGRDARPAGVDAGPAGRGLQAHRPAARGLHRHGSRPHRHADAPRARRGRQVRGVPRRRPRQTCRSPTAPRSGTCRRRWAPPARSSRSTRRRSATSSSRAAPRSASSSWRRTAGSRASSTTRTSRMSTYSDTLELDLGEVVPSLAGPKRPQDRVALVGRGLGLPRRARGVHGPRDADRLRRGHRRVVPLERPAHEQRRRRVAEGRSQPPAAGHRGGRARGGLRTRIGRDRRHHELHQHLEPVRDDRRRPARQEGGRGRARADAVGEDVARAGLEGRDRVPRARRPDRAALEARLRPRRLRLHHLHRELGPAARGGLAGDRGARPCRRERAVGQPQLRGPHPPRGEDELPRLAAALRGLRAGGADGPRHRERAAPERRLPARHLADAAGGQRDHRERDRVGHVRALLRRRAVRGRRQLEGPRDPRGRPLRLGRRLHLREAAALLRGHAGRGARGLRGDQGREGARGARRQRHHGPHLTGGRDQEGLARRAVPDRARRRAEATSTPTARGAATTR